MRVLQIIDSLQWGGAQKMQIFLAESLKSLGIDITVANLKEKSNNTILKDLTSMDVQAHTFNFPRLYSPKSFLRLIQFIRHSKFDLIHTHLSNANIIGPLAGKITGVPVITTLHNSGLDPRYHHPARVILENMVVRLFASRVMAIGWSVGKFAEQRYKGQDIDILPNAIDPIPPLSLEERNLLRSQLVGDSNCTILLSVGRLSPLKGYHDLINAFNELRKTHPECILIIVGDGTEREKLILLIEELKLTREVLLLGIRNDVTRLMGACDLYINSSHVEGLPITLLEAMAVGLPVVATRVGDIPNLVVQNTGIIVEPNHPDQIAQAVISILENPGLKQNLIAAAKEHIKNNFNRSVWNSRLLTLYTKVNPAFQPVLNSLEQS